jgi:outer membrane protein assembly factor BamB
LTRTEVTAWLRGASEGWQVQEKEGLWVLFRRGPLPGSGEWTHLYADASNSACSSDSLQAPLQVQWFGRPGPRNMIDRHHRAMSPLVKDGRVFIAGNNRVLAVDAYNGTLLWDVGIPHSRRIGAARDCGHLVATRDHVYVAAGEQCWGLDVETGEPSRIFETPPGGDGALHQWGYLASVGDLLFGSGEKPGASRTEHSRDAIVEGTYWDERPVVVSDTLFCLNRHTGERLWLYPPEGGRVIINSAIAVGGDHVYFVESRSPGALADGDGRVTLEVLLASGQAFLVKLHQETGQKVWERPVEELSPLRHVLFLSYAPGRVVAVGTRNDSGHPRYDLVAFDERDGSLRWSNYYLRTDKGLNGDHGEQDQHPVIVGNTLYSRPYAFDLQTGQQVAFNLIQGGHGCGTISGSAFYLYGRGGNPRMYPLNAGGGSNIALTQVNRPGCWINILPAGGLVLIPEGSSGCTCGYPLQTSIALVPQGDLAANGEEGTRD